MTSLAHRFEVRLVTGTVWGELVAAEWDRSRYLERLKVLEVRYARLLALSRTDDPKEQARLRLELVREHPSALREMTAPALIARRTADVRTELSSLKGGAPLPAPPERDARVRMLSLADFTWMIRELRALRSVARRHSLTEAWPMYLDQRADPLPSIDLGNLMLSTRRSAVFRTALATCALRYERPDLESLWAPAGPAPQVETIDFVQIGSSADIREGRAKRVEAFGRKIALFRHEGEVCALNDTCPHRGGPLGKGDVEDGAVLCPLHGWAFDLRTGMMRGNERVRVDTYDVVETDGVVTLKLRGSPR